MGNCVEVSNTPEEVLQKNRKLCQANVVILNAMIALARCGEKEDVPALQPIKEGRFGVDDPTRQRAAEIMAILEKK